jgi:quercetin dioxygenase-like cupin family protein
MKKLLCFAVSVLAVILVLGFAVKTTVAEDMMPKSAEVKVLLDNDQVRVSEARRPPGTIVPMHTHPTLVAYYFSPSKVKGTLPNGKSKINDNPAGKIVWFPKGMTHSIEIMGTQDQHVLVIEWKNK